jgi:glycosyltransferase involved in cell wall biosynthesis
MLEDLAQNFGASRKRLALIYNPVDLESISEEIRNGESPFGQYKGPNIVAMGRMAREKNFDKIIKAFEVFSSQVLTAQLWLIGSGALTESLMNISRELGVGDRVHFLGFQKNPYIWLKHADLFVMCSEYEGLPNVLLEALACGCPVIAVDCPGGTREIMERTGNLDRLVPPGKLEIRQEMFERKAYEPIRKSLEDNFGLDSVMKAYEKVLLNAGN